jgi:tetratricopeptide (TPR) repeat protein
MTRPNETTDRTSVTDLFQQYLYRQIDAHAQGLGYAEPAADVVPYEAGPVQPVDPQLAWKDAVTAARLLGPAGDPNLRVPPEWPALVSQQEPAVALAFALGNFPQLVRNLHALLTANPPALRVGPAVASAAPELTAWAAQQDGPQRLLAAGVLRLAGQFDAAAELLDATPADDWQAVHANETAALAWHRGEFDRALGLWQRQSDSVPVLFNRGMAALFVGRPAEAIDALTRAIAGLPETSAWHHLACLYLALAQAR